MKNAVMLAKKLRRSVWNGDVLRWCNLTWNQLEDWAGARSVERGRSYQRQNRVRGLSIDEQGALHAEVSGQDVYETCVQFQSEQLMSECSCPVGFNCKHAVAVILSYLDALERGLEVSKTIGAPTVKRRRVATDEDPAVLESFLNELSAAELRAMLKAQVAANTPLRKALSDRAQMKTGNTAKLLAELRREIKEVTRQPAWVNSWTGEGELPDYSRLAQLLETIQDMGHHDDITVLGRELLDAGTEQVNSSHDEGEAANALSECMAIVFRSVPKSTMPATAKILYVIDADLKDDYDIVAPFVEETLTAIRDDAAWSNVADQLRKRLRSPPATDAKRSKFMHDYQRDRLSTWIGRALKRAGREGERRSLLELEARTTGSYQRLVDDCLATGELDDAAKWAREGLLKTSPDYYGIMQRLLNSLRTIAETRRQWDVVAAHAASEFFERPSVKHLEILLTAAKKAKCEVAVRNVAMAFLETGQLPLEKPGTKARQGWPLPELDYLQSLPKAKFRRSEGPHFDVLIDLALRRKDNDGALRWWDRLRKNRPTYTRSEIRDRIAQAVAVTHPTRALKIFHERLKQELHPTGHSAYDAVCRTLKQMQPAYAAANEPEAWTKLVQQLRDEYRNRPRLVEKLDRLQGQRILSSHPRR